MNIVTKSGTNNLQGSFFELFRDKSMNARTETEKLSDVAKQDYRRNQFGGSFGGPIVKDKAHYLRRGGTHEQNTLQAVDLKGLFPGDGVYTTPYTRDAGDGQGHHQPESRAVPLGALRPEHELQPYGVTPNSPPPALGPQRQQFNSFNLNHNWVLGGAKLNEFIFQYADFSQPHHGEQPGSDADVPEQRDRSARTSTRRRPRSSTSGSSVTTSRGTWPAWAASVTTSRPA